MIIYSGTINNFNTHVINGVIADKIKEALIKANIYHNNEAEYRAWNNSLLRMHTVLQWADLDVNINVSIEYQLPLSSKRVDFIIAGRDSNNKQNAIIIELKQWSNAIKTDEQYLVKANTHGHSLEIVSHPSYQAYAYAKIIENYCENVIKNNIGLVPCSFLHNFPNSILDIKDSCYQTLLDDSPVFLKEDTKKLANFIKQYVSKPSENNILYDIDNGRIRPSKSLQDSLLSMINGNKEFYMVDEQQIAFSTIHNVVIKNLKSDNKFTFIIEGGPGTGKSVIAINLLSSLIKYNVCYVTKTAAPRGVYFKKLLDGNLKKAYVENLFKGSGTFIYSPKNTFDCLIVDEAHRLNKKSGMFQNKGENQIKEIINASRISVFFIDEDQMVTTKDFGTINEIKTQATLLNSTIICGPQYNLVSQFRCNGSDGYISFLDNLLGIRETANISLNTIQYDIKLYDDLYTMNKDLEELNNINNKARMLSGFCFEWPSKVTPAAYDIEIGNFRARWNFNTTKTWAIDKDSFAQVGCIHTSQGLEFDYVGVIIGDDLFYDGGIKTDYTKRAKADKSLNGIKSSHNYKLADKLIRNTYRTLMTRGQKGCFLYCTDKNLSEYLKHELKKWSI